jgi:hypothetical protein
MERKDADYNLKKLKSFNHYSTEAYRHTAKVLEYILFELDELKNRDAEPPSVYGSYAGEPNYNDYPSDDNTVEMPELPEMVDDDIEQSYIDDVNVPMVLASNAMLTPFHALPTESSAGEESKPDEGVQEEAKEDEEVSKEPSRDNNDSKVQWDIVKEPNEVKEPEPERSTDSVSPLVRGPVSRPKRLRIVGEEDKSALHNDSLRRVKDHLRAVKKKSKKRKKK